MSLNAYQRLAQDSINYQMRMHAAEARVAELEVELATLKQQQTTDEAIKPASKPRARRKPVGS